MGGWPASEHGRTWPSGTVSMLATPWAICRIRRSVLPHRACQSRDGRWRSLFLPQLVGHLTACDLVGVLFDCDSERTIHPSNDLPIDQPPCTTEEMMNATLWSVFPSKAIKTRLYNACRNPTCYGSLILPAFLSRSFTLY